MSGRGQNRSILQIVGYQNSGKTTLMEKLIQALTYEGMKVATIKHHGHGGYPEVPKKIVNATYRRGLS